MSLNQAVIGPNQTDEFALSIIIKTVVFDGKAAKKIYFK